MPALTVRLPLPPMLESEASVTEVTLAVAVAVPPEMETDGALV